MNIIGVRTRNGTGARLSGSDRRRRVGGWAPGKTGSRAYRTFSRFLRDIERDRGAENLAKGKTI